MSNTLIEMQARHQIHERLAQRLRPADAGSAPAATASRSGSARSPTGSTADLRSTVTNASRHPAASSP